MSWRPQINEKGIITRYKDLDTGRVRSVSDYQRRMQMQMGGYSGAPGMSQQPGLVAAPPAAAPGAPMGQTMYPAAGGNQDPSAMPAAAPQGYAPSAFPAQDPSAQSQQAPPPAPSGGSPLIQPGAEILTPGASPAQAQTPGSD